MADIKIKKGHDLNLSGKPEKKFLEVPSPEILKISPLDFKGLKPKLLVRENDVVKTGTPLLRDKLHPDSVFCSPGSGVISKVKYGERRRIESISIRLDGKDENESLKSFSGGELASLSADDIKEYMLRTGAWTFIRQRPFSKVADPDKTPKSIFIPAMPTAPFAPDLEFILSQDSDGFQAGLDILSKLTGGKVNLVVHKKAKLPVLTQAKNVEIHRFSGPHPAGNVGIHIHYIDPIRNMNDIVWYLGVQDVLAIGRLFTKGEFPRYKYITVGGSGVAKRGYLKIRRGMTLGDILRNNSLDGDVRLISGDVLSGKKKNIDDGLGFYDEVISVIPESRKREFLGWLSPGFKKYSLSNTFPSKLLGLKDHGMNTAMNGSERAIIPFGQIESVLPMDIMPTFLLKAVLSRDIEEMEKLGIYECDPEDFALCTFVDVSKMEISRIIREGLEFIEAEG